MIYILIFYLIILVAYAAYSIAAIYHLWRFGFVGDLTKKAIIIYLILSTVVIVTSLILILTRAWPSEIKL